MTKQIPYHRPYPFSVEELDEINRSINPCLRSGQLTNGVFVRELEEQVREMYDVDYCIALSSCTQGLMACWWVHEHRTTYPSFTWKSLKYINKTRYYLFKNEVDIDRETWLPLGNPTFGLHTFGNILNNSMIQFFDASHALGCTLPEIGLATVFSLAATKIVTSCEGGLLITNAEHVAEVVKEYRDLCARMSEIHAIMGLQALKHLPEVMEWKKEVYDWYSKKIPGQFQKIPITSNYNTIGFLNVNDLKIPKEIETRQYYEPLKKGLPNTDYVYSKMVCLPSWYNCPKEKIVELIKIENE